jgi:hypothetical protein
MRTMDSTQRDEWIAHNEIERAYQQNAGRRSERATQEEHPLVWIQDADGREERKEIARLSLQNVKKSRRQTCLDEIVQRANYRRFKVRTEERANMQKRCLESGF